jgi:hypothetical protein
MATIYVCFTDRLEGRRSDVLGPFVSVDMSYGSLMVGQVDGTEEVLAYRKEEAGAWEHGGREYPTVLIVSEPDSPALCEIATDI